LSSVPVLGQSGSGTLYRNPVIAGDFADPSVIRVGETYYAVGTSSEWGPAYPVYSSTDLVNWDYLGPVFFKLPSWTMGSYWAPELYYRKGTYYVYYTARRRSDRHSYIGVASTTDIRKGFTDHGCLIEWTTEAIDAFVIEDGGKLYITWKAYGLDKGKRITILGRELTPDGLKVTGEVFALLQADPASWEAGGAEGQALFRRGKYVYMTYSGNNCCGRDCNYQVGLARAEKLQGPWEKYAGNPVLVSGDTWKCPGHGTVVTTPDNRYFYMHHAYHATDFTFVGRQGVLSELVWNEQTGWPAFRYGNTPPIEASLPIQKTQNQTSNQVADLMKPTPHAASWVWDVTQPKPVYRIEKGYLQLEVSDNLTDPAANFLGLVVRKGTYTFAVEVQPQPDVLQSICVYGDAHNALGLGVRNDSLLLWQVKEGTQQILQTVGLRKQPVELLLHATEGGRYQFSWWYKGRMEPVPVNAQPIDGAFLPRWDRAPRVGISATGARRSYGQFRSVAMKYE
jgi:beta-xylosidase